MYSLIYTTHLYLATSTISSIYLTLNKLNFSFAAKCHLLKIFKIPLFWFLFWQNGLYGKQFGSGWDATLCGISSGSKLFAKIITTRVQLFKRNKASRLSKRLISTEIWLVDLYLSQKSLTNRTETKTVYQCICMERHKHRIVCNSWQNHEHLCDLLMV